MNVFELSSVRMSYARRRILDVEHLVLEEGVTYSLQGPNGAGKSTLLGILALLTPPHEGRVRFLERDVNWTAAALRPLRRLVGLVEQHPVMFSRSVRDNVGYGLRLRGVRGARLQRDVGHALDIVGLGHLSEAYGPQLSGGETQRVAIARALALKPRVLLLDEPTASVDGQNRRAIEQVIADIRDAGTMTVILCTHNRAQAWALCPNVVYLEGGRVVSRALMNVFSCRFESEGGQTYCCVTDSLCLPVATECRGRGRVAIDPESVRLSAVDNPGVNRGPVVRLEMEGTNVLLTVDLGRPLCAQMTSAEFDALGVNLGSVVDVSVPPEGLDCAG